MLQPQAQSLPKTQSLAEFLEGKDPVQQVNQLCQRLAGKPLTKEDIVFENAALAQGSNQCTATLACMDGQEFAGEICKTSKEAKVSAAQQVLLHFADQMRQMPANAEKAPKSKKRAASDALDPAEKMARIEGTSNKGELNATYSKIIRRPTGKGEVVYTTQQVQGGFQSQVQLPGLPPPWNNESWAGEAMPKKADAEQSVAGVALATIRGDAKLMAMHNAPPKPNQWILKGGLQRQREKGKGKGNSDYSSAQSAASSSPTTASFASHDPNVYAQYMASMYPQYMAASLQAGATGFV